MTTRYPATRSCDGKKRYAKHHAERAVKHLRQIGENVHAYACKYCGHHHVGHNSRVK